jgi:hypothetical protein
MTLRGENAVNFLCTPKWRELEGTLHPQKFGCTPKNEGKRVHVPPDEKTCGHAGLLIKCYKYFVLCLLYITDTIPWQAVCISTTLKYNRSLEKHVLAHFQWTCSQIYFRFSSYLLRIPLLIKSTAFICNIDRDWMIYRKHPIRSLLTLMLRKANIRYSSDVFALSFEKYKGK